MPFSDHAEKHRELHSILAKAFAEVREGKQEVFSLLRYIDYWFERHISDEDRHFCARLSHHRSVTQTELQAA
jgi:hemerythrin